MSVATDPQVAVPARPLRIAGFSGAQAACFVIMIALIIGLPYVGIYPVFLMKVLCFALFACAFNLLIGYIGLMSFGHAAFFGMGSYVTAWTAKNWGLTPEVAILLGGLTGAGLGVVFGWLAIRRQGIYFAMITLALAQMVYFFCLQAPFTGGEDGIQQVPRGALFGEISLRSDMTMYAVIAVIFLIFFLLIHRVVHSPFGQVLKSIRENEPRATSLGYRTDDYKLIAFVLSCFIAGIAGGAKALVFGIATLTDVNYGTSGDVVLMTLLGGLGTIFGPVVGAAVIVGLENYLAQFGSWVTVTQGAIFVVCVLAFRRGIIGEVAALFRTSLLTLDLDAYFGRIVYRGPRTPELATVRALHALHSTRIPFECLDPLLGRRVALDVAAIQAKLVTGRRGGYCFEHNALFAAVLEALGLEITRLGARVRWMAPPGRPEGPRSHMLLRADFPEGPYLLDVGFGGYLLSAPVRLERGLEQRSAAGTVRLVGDEPDWLLQAKLPSGWHDLYRFTLEPQLPADYLVSNWFTSTHPDSQFTSNLIAQRLTEEGRMNLLNAVLTLRRYDGTSEERRLVDAAELAETLETGFGINLPVNPAEIWERVQKE